VILHTTCPINPGLVQPTSTY